MAILFVVDYFVMNSIKDYKAKEAIIKQGSVIDDDILFDIENVEIDKNKYIYKDELYNYNPNIFVKPDL